MNETLKGNLSQLKLVDILQILCNSQRTGKLSLMYGDDAADIYFLSGNIIHARYGESLGEDVIYQILSWNEGLFTFYPNISVKNRTINTPVSTIIEKSKQIENEWSAIRKSIPNVNLVFKMSSGTPSEISLTANEWNILRHINGVDCIKTIAKKVDMPLLDVTKAFLKLYQADLIEMVGEAVAEERVVRGIDPSIFVKIEKEFAQIIGAMAPIIIDDQIEALGEKREAFPKEKLPELIEQLSQEISNPKKLIEFQKNMLDLIKTI